MNELERRDLPQMKVVDIADVLRPDEPRSLSVRSRGGILTPLPDEEVYQGLFDTKSMNTAYIIFMKGGSFDDCAEATGIPQRTIFKWAQQGSWVKVRAEIEQIAAEEEAQRLDMLRREKRIPEIEKQIEAGSKLRELVAEKLDSDEEFKPSELKMLGEALKAAGDNTVRALGVSDSGDTGFASQDKAKGGDKIPLIVMIQGGGLPPVRVAQTIAVEAIEE